MWLLLVKSDRVDKRMHIMKAPLPGFPPRLQYLLARKSLVWPLLVKSDRVDKCMHKNKSSPPRLV